MTPHGDAIGILVIRQLTESVNYPLTEEQASKVWQQMVADERSGTVLAYALSLVATERPQDIDATTVKGLGMMALRILRLAGVPEEVLRTL